MNRPAQHNIKIPHSDDELYGISADDRRIIQATQAGLPLTDRPYHTVAEQLGMDVHTLLQRMREMSDRGIIRRIGLVPNHYKLGYTGNGMSVWDVDDLRIDELGMKIGALDFVSHCYQRPRFLPEWPYNLFAMVHGRHRDEVLDKVEQIAMLLGQDDRGHDVLFSSRILKKTGLRIA
mgnify:FL=1